MVFKSINLIVDNFNKNLARDLKCFDFGEIHKNKKLKQSQNPNKAQFKIPSVNFHLWEPCNMRCNFCYATFQDIKKTILPKGHIPKEESIQIIHALSEFGFKKITFAGGEPTLCPWLPELIVLAKKLGMTTMIVSNGSQLNAQFLEKMKGKLDWISISIDSLNPETNLK